MNRKLAVLSGLDMVIALALIEPAMGRLEKLGDALEAKQYLLIMPTGEVAYLFPPARELSVPMLGRVGAAMLAAGLLPALGRLRRKGLDRLSTLGWSMVLAGTAMLVSEYRSGGEWVLFGRIGARYLASAMVAVGSFLCVRDRTYLATLGMGGFTWDLSSAIFWARLRGSWRATVPVPWYHHFDQEEGRGAPCWLVALLDACGIAYFAWVSSSRFDPFRLFDEEGEA